jgi:hypothetical protein
MVIYGWLDLVMWHMVKHGRELDFDQICWDKEWHFGLSDGSYIALYKESLSAYQGCIDP